MMNEVSNRVGAAGLFGVLVLILLAFPVAAQPQSDGYSPAERAEQALIDQLQMTTYGRIRATSAVITDVDFEGPRIVADGRAFNFSPAARVNLLSGAGAPTLLQQGMAIRMLFESPTAQSKLGVIHNIDEIEVDELMVF